MTLDTTLTVAIRKWTPLSSAANSHLVTALEICTLQCNKIYDQAYCTDIHVFCRMYLYVLLQWLSSCDQSCAYALVWIWLYSVPVLRRLRCNQPLDQSPFIRVAPCSKNLHQNYHLFGTNTNTFNVPWSVYQSLLHVCTVTIQFDFLKFLLLHQIRPWPCVFGAEICLDSDCTI